METAEPFTSPHVLDALTDLFILRGPPEYIRSDNGPELVVQKVRDWIAAVGSKTAFIEPGTPWENGYCESFNARFRDELLNGELFYTLRRRGSSSKPGEDTTTPFGLTAPLDPATRTGKYRPDGPEAGHALTINPDHSMGAYQGRSGCWRSREDSNPEPAD